MAWFLAPYKRRLIGSATRVMRYCAMDDFTPQITADGGAWTETEVLGNHAIVKVRASAATLSTINAAAGFVRLPKDALDSVLTDLTLAQKTALRDKIEELGYPRAEWQADLGADLSLVTMRDILVFLTKRRREARYDPATDTIVCDGPLGSVRPLESVDAEVSIP